MNAAQRSGFKVRHFPNTPIYRASIRLGYICSVLAAATFLPIFGSDRTLFSTFSFERNEVPRSHVTEQSVVTPSRNTQLMRRNPPTAHLPGAATLQITSGETIHIGPDVQVHLSRTADGRAELSIWAPRNLRIDRSKNFRSTRNSDGQGVAAPQPSATNSPSSTKTQE